MLELLIIFSKKLIRILQISYEYLWITGLILDDFIKPLKSKSICNCYRFVLIFSHWIYHAEMPQYNRHVHANTRTGTHKPNAFCIVFGIVKWMLYNSYIACKLINCQIDIFWLAEFLNICWTTTPDSRYYSYSYSCLHTMQGMVQNVMHFVSLLFYMNWTQTDAQRIEKEADNVRQRGRERCWFYCICFFFCVMFRSFYFCLSCFAKNVKYAVIISFCISRQHISVHFSFNLLLENAFYSSDTCRIHRHTDKM